MFKKCAFFVRAILLLTSAGFAAMGQAHGHTLVAPGNTATVGHGQRAYSYYYCGAVDLQQQTSIVRCQNQPIRWFYWWSCKPTWKPPCKPACKPLWKPPYIVEGGDASVTATVVSYGGNADATAQAVGGDAILVITCKPASNLPYLVKGGDASATATAVSYGGSSRATAHAVGGDAILVIN